MASPFQRSPAASFPLEPCVRPPILPCMALGSWIEPHPTGIFIPAANAWVDPSEPVPRALVTHGHADHARGGHGEVWATPETLAIMGVRYGEQTGHPMAYDEAVSVGEVEARFVPAGHVLGS